MAKKDNKNKTIIAISISSVVCVGLIIGSFFLGYNIGLSNKSNNEEGFVNGPESYPEWTLEGAYRRSYYNNYNKSVDSYVVLKSDGTCKFVSSVASEYSTSVDLDTMDEKCSYTYDENTKNGELSIKDGDVYYKNDTVEYKPKVYKFTYDSGSFLLGGATYYRVQ